MASPITGDFGIITVLRKGELSGDTTPVTAEKRTGMWVEVKNKAASGSIFGDLKVGDLFFTHPKDIMTPKSGDSFYPYTEYWLGFAVNWSISITPSIIDTTPLGARFPRSIQGRPTVDSTINCFLEEGVQAALGSVDADELPTIDFRELKQQYIDVIRFEREGTKGTPGGKTKPPKTAVGDTSVGIFDTTKAANSVMFYSAASDVGIGVVSAYFAPRASWAGLTIGSGDAGSRSDFSLPVTFQHDELNRTMKGYELHYE